jgi:hypothetical protein
MLTQQRLYDLRLRFLPVYQEAMTASGGDLWGCSPLDLACDNLPEVPSDDLAELLLFLGIGPADEVEAYRRFREVCERIDQHRKG